VGDIIEHTVLYTIQIRVLADILRSNIGPFYVGEPNICRSLVCDSQSLLQNENKVVKNKIQNNNNKKVKQRNSCKCYLLF